MPFCLTYRQQTSISDEMSEKNSRATNNAVITYSRLQVSKTSKSSLKIMQEEENCGGGLEQFDTSMLFSLH